MLQRAGSRAFGLLSMRDLPGPGIPQGVGSFPLEEMGSQGMFAAEEEPDLSDIHFNQTTLVAAWNIAGGSKDGSQVPM